MKIKFSYETKYGSFSDSLNLPDDHAYSESELETLKEQRRDNWIAYIDSTQIETPVETPDETPDETPSEPALE